jgi:hypothetical protein
MAFWNKLFGNEKAQPQGAEPPSHQLPSSIVAKHFGEVNVRKRAGVWEVSLTILMEPQGAEGWQTGVALDASGSMEGLFGRLLEAVPGRGNVPPNIMQDLARRNLIGQQGSGETARIILTNEAANELKRLGYFRDSQNDVQPQARKFTAYLAGNLDADGGTTVIYWACGDGSQIEVLGDFTADQCETATFKGPEKVAFGQKTMLTPAVKYFVDRFSDAKMAMYVFITDGELNDLEEVKKYTIRLCREIQAKKRNPLKCVLIGLGSQVNEDQMEQLDDLDSGTEVDIWDHKIAKDMRTITEIFAELVSENQVVAPTGRILDGSGQVVKVYSDGVPAKISFTMPATSEWFELEVGGERIRQPVVAQPANSVGAPAS